MRSQAKPALDGIEESKDDGSLDLAFFGTDNLRRSFFLVDVTYSLIRLNRLANLNFSEKAQLMQYVLDGY